MQDGTSPCEGRQHRACGLPHSRQTTQAAIQEQRRRAPFIPMSMRFQKKIGWAVVFGGLHGWCGHLTSPLRNLGVQVLIGKDNPSDVGRINKRIDIRAFTPGDAGAVRELFVRVNRLLAPAEMREAFEIYIVRSLTEEIDRLADYYSERNGGFWVAVDGGTLIGMFGLERSADGAMELRRMYVDPDVRRRGVARRMLDFAEQECRRRGRLRMNLSTSELQREALALYRNAGYELVREEVAVAASNKTLGGGIRRYHFTKAL
jgi:GNAT superfamily N-acetyltransferase